MTTIGDDRADINIDPATTAAQISNHPAEYSEISVLIPGYSVEDLPTDLPEDEAASLLNAIACAWHPRLLQRASGIPVFRQAESLTGYPGRRIVFVPAPSESWMPHEWRAVFQDQGHIVLAGCSQREDWLAAIDAALSDEGREAAPDANQLVNPASALPQESSNSSAGAVPVLVEHFLALGIVMLQVQLLSRRRHHFVDADKILLNREVQLAAEASIWAARRST